ncbi:hypothetical protein VP01_435g3 [Puccinia sorghi]|uniref:Uncharacterized protein n=1 Tax=Puccinia sorghi TaxID=27349 RepID=A0A0L6URT1_9BASI|nr:hypothetical protein VP01_435g3 [Puccinia sorghi]
MCFISPGSPVLETLSRRTWRRLCVPHASRINASFYLWCLLFFLSSLSSLIKVLNSNSSLSCFYPIILYSFLFNHVLNHLNNVLEELKFLIQTKANVLICTSFNLYVGVFMNELIQWANSLNMSLISVIQYTFTLLNVHSVVCLGIPNKGKLNHFFQQAGNQAYIVLVNGGAIEHGSVFFFFLIQVVIRWRLSVLHVSAISEPRVDVGQGEESFGVDHGAIGLSEGPTEKEKVVQQLQPFKSARYKLDMNNQSNLTPNDNNNGGEKKNKKRALSVQNTPLTISSSPSFLFYYVRRVRWVTWSRLRRWKGSFLVCVEMSQQKSA